MNHYAILAIAIAAFSAGALVNGWRLGEQMQAERNAWAESEQKRMDKERAEAAARALEVWVADQNAQKEITERENRLSEFERCIAAGRGCGLRVKVKPAACPNVPAGEASGVGSGAVETAELDDSARSDYRTLRNGIERLEKALKVCVAASEDVAP